MAASQRGPSPSWAVGSTAISKSVNRGTLILDTSNRMAGPRPDSNRVSTNERHGGQQIGRDRALQHEGVSAGLEGRLAHASARRAR